MQNANVYKDHAVSVFCLNNIFNNSDHEIISL